VPEPFRYLLRVRYGECDPQQIVFNARWGDYVDIACTELMRALFGTVDPSAGIDWKLVRQELQWKASARFDDVIEARVSTVRVGTTSFTLATAFHRFADGALLVTAETVYVVVEPGGGKKAVPDWHRERLETGAHGVVVDHAGVTTR
jgi:acyl-CoA thioester hydrolase